MLKKFLYPIIHVSEWVLFFAVLLLFFLFNMINLFNLIYIDMPWEEAISLTSSLIKSFLLVLGTGFVSWLYIRNLTGNIVYNKIKQIFWGVLYGLNTFSSVFWLLISFPTNVSVDERILRLLITLICITLTTKIILLCRNQVQKNTMISD